MGKRFIAVVWLWSALVGLRVEPALAYIADDRWDRTATNSSTGSTGSPITLTWSFAPDATLIPGNTTGTTVGSNLLSFLDTNWGIGSGGSDLTQRPWFPIFEQSFARLGELSGVVFVYEPKDDSRDFSNAFAARGILGVRGDIRLGGKSYGSGSNTLASNFYPDYGEMMINTDKLSFFGNNTNNYRPFRNTLMHEVMHGIGISHVESSNAQFLIEPILQTNFEGPQLDDLLAMQRLYGDIYERNGGNDFYTAATPLGDLSPPQPLQIGALGSSTVIQPTQVDFVSIDDDSDTDYFRFSLDTRLDVSLQLSPRGTTYNFGPEDGTQSAYNTLALSDLSLSLFDTNGISLLSQANANPAGLDEEILRQLLPGTYYARVKGAQSTLQLYGLNISASQPAAAQLVWVGNLSSEWNVGATANFLNGAASAVFYDFDHVTFDDSSSVKTVQLASNVSAGNVHVSTEVGYTFTGPGGVVAGSLLVDGNGIVEFANSGNSYAGDTQVLAGTLAITGDANAMQSAITIAGGATLRMDATDAASMTSTFTIAPDGVLQIGTPASVSNVFPDDPPAIFNQGTIRVFASETLSSVAGTGRIEIEHGTTTLASNADFAGAVAVKAGAVAIVDHEAGLGSADTSVVIENGGLMQLVAPGSVSQSIQVDQGATLELAGTQPFDESARLTGRGQVMGELSMAGTLAPGDASDSSGLLTLTDNLSLLGTSRLEYRLGGPTAGTDFASLDVGGSVLLAGTLEVALVNDFTPSFGDTFELLTAAGGISDVFENLVLPELAGDLLWSVVYDTDSVALHVAANVVSLPGDFNLDGTVDAADYTVWRDGLDTLYTLADYDVWKSHFGQSSGGGSASLAKSQGVPEPTGILLALAAAAMANLTSLRVGRTTCV